MARGTNMQPCLIPPSDFNPIIHKHITAIWQNTWEEHHWTNFTKSHPSWTSHALIIWAPAGINLFLTGLESDILVWRVFSKGEPPPECMPCKFPLTIKHLLIECVDFNDVRQSFYRVPSLQDLFKTVKPEVILEFLKAAALYRLLWVVWMFACFRMILRSFWGRTGTGRMGQDRHRMEEAGQARGRRGLDMGRNRKGKEGVGQGRDGRGRTGRFKEDCLGEMIPWTVWLVLTKSLQN